MEEHYNVILTWYLHVLMGFSTAIESLQVFWVPLSDDEEQPIIEVSGIFLKSPGGKHG